MAIGYRDQSSVVAGLGVLVALVAVIGTRFLGWEWGDGLLIPTLIGVGVTGIAVIVVGRRVLNTM